MDQQVADEQATDDTAVLPAATRSGGRRYQQATGQQATGQQATDERATDDTAVLPAGSRSGGRRYHRGRRQAAGSWSSSGGQAEAQVAQLPGPLASAGTLAALLVVFLAGCLLAAWLHQDLAAGLGFCIGTSVVACYGRREALLAVVVSGPVAFLIAEVVAQLATRPAGTHHGTLLPVLEGTVLTLAGVAPWLFAGTAAGVVITMFRGLRRSVRELRADLSGVRDRPRRPARRDHPIS
jgi:hypothetical protein